MIPDAMNLSLEFLVVLPFIFVIAGVFALFDKWKK